MPPRATRSCQEVGFWAAFSGPAVETGRMDAKDFAPSLFATASLIEASSEALWGTPEAVSVQIRADFKKGSFRFELVTIAAAYLGQQLLRNLSLSDLDALLRRIGFRGKDPKSLLGILKKVGTREIIGLEQGKQSTTITVKGDRANITINNISSEVISLFQNERVRRAIPAVLGPLKKEGIDQYRTGRAPRPDLMIEKSDLPKFEAPEMVQTELTDSESETALQLLAPNFVEGNKWRVAQGGEPFWVQILDQKFLGSVNRGERSFRKGDYLIVNLRTRTFATSDGLSVERDVTEVKAHKARPSQPGLFE